MIFKVPLKNSIYFITLVINIACSTQNNKLSKQGGYYEEKINDRTYKVVFEGNQYISDKEVNRLFLLRCAEIASKNQFPYFNVIEKENKIKTSSVVSEGYPMTKSRITALSQTGKTGFLPTIQKTIHKHIINGVIALYHEIEKPANAYVTSEILKEIKR